MRGVNCGRHLVFHYFILFSFLKQKRFKYNGKDWGVYNVGAKSTLWQPVESRMPLTKLWGPIFQAEVCQFKIPCLIWVAKPHPLLPYRPSTTLTTKKECKKRDQYKK